MQTAQATRSFVTLAPWFPSSFAVWTETTDGQVVATHCSYPSAWNIHCNSIGGFPVPPESEWVVISSDVCPTTFGNALTWNRYGGYSIVIIHE